MFKKESVGDRIKRERKILGMSQADVANRAGISVMTISCLELGKTVNPSAENIKPIAMAIKVNPDWMMSGEGDKHQRSPVQTRIAEAMEKANMTVLDLVEVCGALLAAETVDLWLCGAAEPTDAQIILIAGPLGQAEDWLKSGLSVVQENADRVIYDIHGNRERPDVRALVDKYLALNPDSQTAAQTNIDALVKLQNGMKGNDK